MNDIFDQNPGKLKIRYFPIFLIIVLLIGLLLIIILFPSFILGEKVIRIPIIIDEEGADQVEQPVMTATNYELLDGVVYNMVPAPNRRHQQISGAIHNQLYNYLLDQKCEVYHAPFDVRLPVGAEANQDIFHENKVEVYLQNNHKQYGKPAIYTKDEMVPVGIFGDLKIDLKLVFR